MSSRHLRRALGDRGLESGDVPSDDEAPARQPAASAFAGLLSESESDQDEHPAASSDEQAPEAPATPPRTRTRRAKARPAAAADAAASSGDDFDAMLQDLRLAAPGADAADAAPPLDLLAPASEFMDPLAELKRRIGNFSITGEAADQRFSHLIERVQRKSTAGLRRGRSQLVAPHPTWPSVSMAAVGLAMQRLGDGEPGFVLEHSAGYREQLAYAIQHIRLGDIDGLVQHVRMHPYQVDALLVISDYVRMSSAAEAAELVEWCIHLLEKSFPGSGFSPFAAADRGALLVYGLAENRKVHLALFRHVQYLLKRGCYRTAFEFGKALLCLDADDPLMVAPLLGFAALQARQYAWAVEAQALLQAWRPWQADWTFNAAAAMFLLGDTDMATAMLAGAVEQHPAFTAALLEADPRWAACAGPHAAALGRIYARRTAPVWKDARLAAWLHHVAEASAAGAQPDGELLDDPAEHARIYRHAVLSDLDGLNVALPPRLSARAILIYDPIPPETLDGHGGGFIGAVAHSMAEVLGRLFGRQA